jgi:hypothetical protein
MRTFLIAMVVLAACAPKQEQADTTSVPAVDTLKPATDTLPARDTSAADGQATKAAPVQAPAQPATKTDTAPTRVKSDTDLGRDRAIKIDTRDKRRQLPTVDTTKRP